MSTNTDFPDTIFSVFINCEGTDSPKVKIRSVPCKRNDKTFKIESGKMIKKSSLMQPLAILKGDILMERSYCDQESDIPALIDILLKIIRDKAAKIIERSKMIEKSVYLDPVVERD